MYEFDENEDTHSNGPKTDMEYADSSTPSTSKKSLNQKIQIDKWEKYLYYSEVPNELIYFDKKLNLPEHSIIEKDCKQLLDSLEIPDEKKASVFLDLLTVITVYCKSQNQVYETGNGWMALLGHLVMKNLLRYQIYDSFKDLRDRVPKGRSYGSLLRLLIQYHEPNFCKFFDESELSIAKCTKSWANTLLSGICDAPVVNNTWKYVFNIDDPFFIIFLFLVILIEFREEIIKVKQNVLKNKYTIEKMIEKIPRQIDEHQINDLLLLAENYDLRTPSLFKEKCYPYIFGNRRAEVIEDMCLPVSAQEVMRTIFVTSPQLQMIKYLVVDCRPLNEFDAGHLPIGYYIDSNCIFSLNCPDYINDLKKMQEPKMISFINSFQQFAKHICIMGNGLEENNESVEGVATELLENQVPHVSIIEGGYYAVHNYLNGDYFINHDKENCLVCKENVLHPMQDSTNLSDKENLKVNRDDENPMETESTDISNFSSKVRAKLTRLRKGVKENVLHLIHDNALNKIEVKYTDELDGINIKSFLKSPEVLAAYGCKQIDGKKRYSSYLVLTNQNLILFRVNQHNKKMGHILTECPLVSVSKVTLSKKNSNVLTLKVDKTSPNVRSQSDTITVFIPNGKEAATLIVKKLIK